MCLKQKMVKDFTKNCLRFYIGSGIDRMNFQQGIVNKDYKFDTFVCVVAD